MYAILSPITSKCVMSDSQASDPTPEKRPPVTRIEDGSFAFKWVIPAVLIAAVVITLILFVAAFAVLFDVLPRG